jgi:hypothetical protein
VVGNVTVNPANDTVDTNLVAITFNITGITTLTADDIRHFALWNDTNANGVLDVDTDQMLTNISATDVNASFTGLSTLTVL